MRYRSLKISAFLNSLKQIMTALFPLITIPYVTRILGTDVYGRVNFSSSIVSYFLLFAGLGISFYCTREGSMLRENPVQFRRFASQMFSLNILTATGAFILLFLTVVIIPGLHPYWLLILIQSLQIVSNTLGLDWVNTCYEDFLYITVRYLIFQTIALICMFLFVKSPDDYLIYAFLSILSTFGGELSNVVYIRRYVKVYFTIHIDLKKHIKSILLLFGNNLANIVYVSSATTLVGIMLSDAAVGIYSIPLKIYSLVKGVLSAVILVAVPRVSSLLSEGKRDNAFRILDGTFSSLLVFVLPSTVGLFMLSDELIILLAGGDFKDGGALLKVFSFALLISDLSCFLANNVLIPFKREDILLKSTIAAGVSSVVANIMLIHFFGLIGSSYAILISEFVMLVYCGMHSLDYYCPHIDYREVLDFLFGSLLVGVYCSIIRFLISDYIYILIFSIVPSFFIYIIFLIARKNNTIYSLLRPVMDRIRH